jgi:hypothetical protein
MPRGVVVTHGMPALDEECITRPAEELGALGEVAQR